MAKHSEIVTSLRKHGGAHLNEPTIQELANGLLADGLCEADGAIHAAAARGLRQLTVMEAAAQYPEASARLKRVKAMAARMGFQIEDNKTIDSFALDAALRGQPLERRMELKAELASLHLIG